MNRKRRLFQSGYGVLKKQCRSTAAASSSSGAELSKEDADRCEDKGGATEQSENDDEHLPAICDTKSAMLLIKNLFPLEKFESHFPAIILQHQIYNIVKNRTTVDNEIEELRQCLDIRKFRLGTDICLVFESDYAMYVESFAKDLKYKDVVCRFLKSLPIVHDVSVNKDTLMKELKFTDKDITSLVNVGVLVVRDIGSWWLAIPGAGKFVKALISGRKAVVSMVQHCKYKQVMQSCLEKRHLPANAFLGMQYYIHDVLGSDKVCSMNTTTGVLLRMPKT